MSHSCRCQRHFSVPVWKHRWARSVLRLWPARGLIVVFWPCSATLCANQVLGLLVLLWVSCSCVLSQRLCTMNKGSKNYLLSISHVDFSGLFLFCFECEWKVPSAVAQAEFSLWQCPLGQCLHLRALHALSMKSWWPQPPSVVPCDRGAVNACHSSETSFISALWGLLDLFPNRFRRRT